ncbi:shikimate dehydrogenase [Kibdelosporangium banguiense]|uniref:Shikimate dehydrogenase n=1 Tax=Kibdelosporangium banguiense TaxID=1365924 RepID=A0ABS4TNE1_9PSEU|nr:shikimate dehydrogenase [Kibdelosporangium banguiense]MBP2325926.1 shikimate dehydrogenase [Kibdelosporangium banguiense]
MAVAPHDEDRYLVGLIGSGIETSLSPALHERAADELGLRYLYRKLDLTVLGLPPEAVGELVAAARLAGYNGLNITHPCKQLVLEHLDGLSPEAEALQAVNTVVFADGKAIGHNTDLSGFARNLALGLPEAPLDNVVLLGAGGAGAAAAHALLTMGAGTVHVFDTDQGRCDKLIRSLHRNFGPDRAATGKLDDVIPHADGLVHATPTGMAAYPGLPLPAELIMPHLWVADVVYRPLNTELVMTAHARGCGVLDGGGMVVFQAAEAFRLFTGRTPDTSRMLHHFAALTPGQGRSPAGTAGGRPSAPAS